MEKAEMTELVEFIMTVQKLDKAGLALLRSNAEMLARYEELKREVVLPQFLS